MTKEDLQQIREVMREELKPVYEKLDKVDERLDKVDERLDKVDERLGDLEESMEIIKYSTNELVRWVDTNFRHKFPFPIDKDIV